MKYLIILLALFFLGCDNKKSNTSNPIKKQNKIIIKGEDFNLTFKNKKLIYPKKRVILLFFNKSSYSLEEEKILKRLNLTFHKTNNKFLKSYFKIRYYPTIVILDKNQTIKYENFTPYEILKAEGL